MTRPIQMVDLKTQYEAIKHEIDASVLEVINSTRYIKGPVVEAFERELASYLGVKHVIACANGTDALQIALMAIDLEPGDEVIVPSFTYVATAEVIGLLGLTPVMVDVDPAHFNTTAELIEPYISEKTKAIVPVHLFGQCAPMDPIMTLATKHGLHVIEDAAQAIGSQYIASSDQPRAAGTIGHMGTTSFFPSKNLGCYGDGGAMMTNDDDLAATLRMIANHGQSRRYYHDRLGVNSRLDAIQAAILRVKLKHLDRYNTSRRTAAERYNQLFAQNQQLITPLQVPFSTHVFHQYTLQVPEGLRDGLIAHLNTNGIPAMIYYPVPLYKQKAFSAYWNTDQQLLTTEHLSKVVVSLPMHSEMTDELVDTIAHQVNLFFHA